MPCPRTQQANLPACSPQPPQNAECQAGKLQMSFSKVFWYDSTRGMNPRSTDYDADALTTTPSCRSTNDSIYFRQLSTRPFILRLLCTNYSASEATQDALHDLRTSVFLSIRKKLGPTSLWWISTSGIFSSASTVQFHFSLQPHSHFSLGHL